MCALIRLILYEHALDWGFWEYCCGNPKIGVPKIRKCPNCVRETENRFWDFQKIWDPTKNLQDVLGKFPGVGKLLPFS